MPVFQYKALNEKGQVEEGVVDADSAKDARDRLRLKRIHVTQMSRIEKKVGEKKEGFHLGQVFRRKKEAEVAMMTRQLATLIRSGTPPAEALKAMTEQIEDRQLETVFRQIKEDVQGGSTVADAFARHPFYFNKLYIAMLRAGEAAGDLDSILKRLADFLQKKNKVKGKVTAAMAYPAVMLVMGSLVVTFLMTYVVPKITKVILDRPGGKNSIPLPTQVLMTLSGFIASYWWLIPPVVAIIIATYYAWIKKPEGRLKRDTLLLKIPIFGDLLRKQAISRFAITFSTLLKSGIPALECLKILRNVVNNQLLANTLEKVHDRILEGTDIATPLQRSGVFPPVVGYMIAIGEQSGELEEILDRLTESYDEEIEISTQKVTSMIEPLVIVFMAVIVGFIVMAVVLPLVQGFNM